MFNPIEVSMAASIVEEKLGGSSGGGGGFGVYTIDLLKIDGLFDTETFEFTTNKSISMTSELSAEIYNAVGGENIILVSLLGAKVTPSMWQVNEGDSMCSVYFTIVSFGSYALNVQYPGTDLAACMLVPMT